MLCKAFDVYIIMWSYVIHTITIAFTVPIRYSYHMPEKANQLKQHHMKYKYTLRDEIMGIDEEVDNIYNKYTISLFAILLLTAIILKLTLAI